MAQQDATDGDFRPLALSPAPTDKKLRDIKESISLEGPRYCGLVFLLFHLIFHGQGG